MFFIFFFLLLLLVYRAAREYGVPESTLRDRTLGLVDADNCISGSKRTFAVDEEHELAEDIKYMASMGYGYSKQEVINLATILQYFKVKKSPDVPPPCAMWFYSFLKTIKIFNFSNLVNLISLGKNVLQLLQFPNITKNSALY